MCEQVLGSADLRSLEGDCEQSRFGTELRAETKRQVKTRTLQKPKDAAPENSVRGMSELRSVVEGCPTRHFVFPEMEPLLY